MSANRSPNRLFKNAIRSFDPGSGRFEWVPGASQARPALACQTLVEDGMEIEGLSADLERALASALRTAEEAEPVGAQPRSGG